MKSVKIFTGISLGLFLVTVTALLTAAFVTKSNQELTTGQGSGLARSGVTNGEGGVTGGGEAFLTIEEVGKHKTAEDCWMVIQGSVYNLTGFLVAHPGGAASMTPYCGKDGTQAFATKDKSPGSKHSTMAEGMLGQYFVGKLGQLLAKNESGGANPTGATTLGQNTVPTMDIKSVPTSGLTNTSGSGLVLTAGEVARHASLADCWMIISGKVYNLTGYIVMHPGGAGAISRYCGGDGSAGFATKDKSPGASHSALAQGLLGNYVIGTVGQTVAVNPAIPTNPVVPTNAPGPLVSPTTASGGLGSVPTLPPANVALTSSEVARHNNLADCWLLISNKVYNVTSYIVRHPGGAAEITNMCGKESTNAFQTKGGGGGNHSNSAYSLLSGYYIGDLNASVQVNPTSTPVPGAPTNTPMPASGGDLPAAISNKYPGSTRRSGSWEDDGSWEGKINTASGQCREMKVNSGGSITKDEGC